MREQTHYSAPQRQQRQPCADDHAAFIHKSGERKGSKGSRACCFCTRAQICLRQATSLRARGIARASSPLAACVMPWYCVSINACCMQRACAPREKNPLISCGGLAVAVPIARLLHVSIVILEGSTVSAGSTHEHSKKRETGISKQRCNHGDKKWLP